MKTINQLLVNEPKLKALLKASAKKGQVMVQCSAQDNHFYITDRYMMIKLPYYPVFMFEIFHNQPAPGEQITVHRGNTPEITEVDTFYKNYQGFQDLAQTEVKRLRLTMDFEKDTVRLFQVGPHVSAVNTKFDGLIPIEHYGNLRGTDYNGPVVWDHGVMLPIRNDKESIKEEVSFLFQTTPLKAVR